MKLEISRPTVSDTHVDVYDLDDKASALSPVLEHLLEGYDGDVLGLPVTFEHNYMQLVVQYLNYFAKASLPLKLPVPLPEKTGRDILHPQVDTWLHGLTLTQLARLRHVVMYFDITSFLDQIDGMLALAILHNPKDVFKTLHEPTLTLASKDSVTDIIPILS